MNIRRSLMIAVVSAATGLIGLPHVAYGQAGGGGGGGAAGGAAGGGGGARGGGATSGGGTSGATSGGGTSGATSNSGTGGATSGGGTSGATSGGGRSGGTSNSGTSGATSNKGTSGATSSNGSRSGTGNASGAGSGTGITSSNTNGVTPTGSGTAGGGVTPIGSGNAGGVTPIGGSQNGATDTRVRRHRKEAQSQLVNGSATTGFAMPMVVPYYGAVPYNGFGFGYTYGGWGDVYGNNGVGGDENLGSDVNGGAPVAASPTNATQNPDAEAARSQLVSEQSRLLKEFMDSPEYKQAIADVRKATDEFNAAVQKAQGSASQQPQVQQASSQEQQAQQQVEAKQAAHHIQPGATPAPAEGTATPPTATRSGNVSGADFPADLTQAAQKKLEAKTQAKQARNDKVLQDPNVQQAKQRLDEAVAHLQELQSKFEQQVTSDKQWQEAKQKLDTAMAGATPSNRK